jgi:uncharacterized protein (DUF342 family)
VSEIWECRLVDLERGEVLLPNYLLRRPDGISVDLSLFPLEGGFNAFVDRLFSEGGRWVGANYPLLSNLLFDCRSVLDLYGANAKINLAQDVTVFPPNRKALYKGVKLDGQHRFAEYFFEPVEMEIIVEEAVYGEPDENGIPPNIGSAHRSEFMPTKLELDEFVADMWLKGIRFGIQYHEVAGVIARSETIRMVVARQLDPSTGSDAEIEEANPALHRDNSPKILPNGKADLRKFQNRFPQIQHGARLLKKIPRVLGKPGYKINGEIIEAEIPTDVDLQALAGPGTRIEVQEGIEFVLSTRDGFLALDVDNNYIAVTEKIENKGGVSVKTTGDLSLSGEEFIEHGEVQEGRSVEGKNMTFRADVYGKILSQGGFILLEANLSNGSAKSMGGNVTSHGRIFNSIVEAWNGHIKLQYAERCLILGHHVTVEHAVNCEIIGETVQVDFAQGCGIAGKNVQLNTADTCRDKETMVSLVLLDLTTLEAQIERVQQTIRDGQKMIAHKDQNLTNLKADAEAAKYLGLAERIQDGSVKLTPAQQDNWNKMSLRFASVKSAAEKIALERETLLKRLGKFQHELAVLMATRTESGHNVQCQIKEIVGETRVRTLTTYSGMAEFHTFNANEIRAKLREPGTQTERIFAAHEGNLSWKFELQPLAQTI